jgi:hypothetical protein
MNKSEVVLKVIGVIMFVAIITIIIKTQSDNCNGALVRGVFWFECVRSK